MPAKRKNNMPACGHLLLFFAPLVATAALGMTMLGMIGIVLFSTRSSPQLTPSPCPAVRYGYDTTDAGRVEQALATAAVRYQEVEVRTVEEQTQACRYIVTERSVLVRLPRASEEDAAQLGTLIAQVIDVMATMPQINRVQVQFVGANLPIWELSLPVAQQKLAEGVEMAWFYRLGMGE